MSVSSPSTMRRSHRVQNWILGVLVVGLFGLGCVALAFGVVFMVSPMLDAAAEWLSGLQLGPWVFGAILFTYFTLPRYVLLAGALYTIRRISRGGYRRFFVGFPIAGLGLVLLVAWPELPMGLPAAAEQAYSTIGIMVVGATLCVLIGVFFYGRVKGARQ